MADAKTEKQKVKEITEELEQGIKELFESEKYKSYLNTMSKFHNYSFNNTVLIAMQKPDATLVAGFNSWKKNFKRHVKKGEKGIRILAPTPYKIKQEQEKTDPKTKEILLDKDGKPIMEEVEITIPAFRAVSVFDVAQTEGKELPELSVKELSDSVEDYENFMQALREISPVPMEFEEIEGDAKGYFSFATRHIAIQEGMSQSQTLKTAIHEVAHAKLHDRNLNRDVEDEKDRNTEEVEAESVAYTVCQHFGIETSDYSFAYIAGWSAGKELPELKASLDTIRRTASEIITGVERELQKERERTVEKEPVDQDRSLETIASTDVVLLVQAEDASEILRITNFSVDDVKRRLRDFALHEERQMAFAVKDKYVSIQVCDEGYDYFIYHDDYSLFDGGIYDNPDITIYAALYDILEDIGAKRRELIPVDYDELAEMAEAVEQEKIAEKQAIMKKEALTEHTSEEEKTIVTLTVAECGEFHNRGEYHEGIASVDEALAIFKSIPQERLHGVPSIGITVHTEGSVIDAGVQMDVVSGKIADLETLEYVPDIINNQEAVAMIQELIAKMPEIEVTGSLVSEKEEIVKGLGRISIKEKLAEKKAIIEQKDKSGKSVPEKDTEKKKQREM